MIIPNDSLLLLVLQKAAALTVTGRLLGKAVLTVTGRRPLSND